MYDDAKFTLLPGICTRDPQTGVITAGTAVTAPQHPGANIATNYADGICHQEALELWHNYESACKFATKALDHVFGSALLDKHNENGALTDEEKTLYQGLWTDKMTGIMKDQEIRTAEKIIDSYFDPSDTMVFFYATYQDGEYILTQLDQSANQENIIRNAVGNLEEHTDYFKYCTRWRENFD